MYYRVLSKYVAISSLHIRIGDSWKNVINQKEKKMDVIILKINEKNKLAKQNIQNKIGSIDNQRESVIITSWYKKVFNDRKSMGEIQMPGQRWTFFSLYLVLLSNLFSCLLSSRSLWKRTFNGSARISLQDDIDYKSMLCLDLKLR